MKLREDVREDSPIETLLQLEFRTIRCNHQKYLIHGTIRKRNKDNSGRHHTTRTPQNMATVRRDIPRNPSVRIRKNNAPVSNRLTNHFQ